jgi:hypothetical protein
MYKEGVKSTICEWESKKFKLWALASQIIAQFFYLILFLKEFLFLSANGIETIFANSTQMHFYGPFWTHIHTQSHVLNGKVADYSFRLIALIYCYFDYYCTLAQAAFVEIIQISSISSPVM